MSKCTKSLPLPPPPARAFALARFRLGRIFVSRNDRMVIPREAILRPPSRTRNMSYKNVILTGRGRRRFANSQTNSSQMQSALNYDWLYEGQPTGQRRRGRGRRVQSEASKDSKDALARQGTDSTAPTGPEVADSKARAVGPRATAQSVADAKAKQAGPEDGARADQAAAPSRPARRRKPKVNNFVGEPQVAEGVAAELDASAATAQKEGKRGRGRAVARYAKESQPKAEAKGVKGAGKAAARPVRQRTRRRKQRRRVPKYKSGGDRQIHYPKSVQVFETQQQIRKERMEKIKAKWGAIRKEAMIDETLKEPNTRQRPNSWMTQLTGRPPFGSYGSKNSRPSSGGLFYGNYMVSYSQCPEIPPNLPQTPQVYSGVRSSIDKPAILSRYNQQKDLPRQIEARRRDLIANKPKAQIMAKASGDPMHSNFNPRIEARSRAPARIKAAPKRGKLLSKSESFLA